MANYENTVDLKMDVLQHAGELTDGTSEFDDKVITYLNRAYQALLSGAADLGLDVGQPWSWAKAQYPGILIISPTITSFLIDATQNSSLITFDTAPAFSVQNYWVTFGDDKQAYRIKSHASGMATATLDSIYIGPTSLASYTRLMKYDYQLQPGILRLFGPMKTNANISWSCDGSIEMIDENRFQRDYNFSVREGIPDKVTEIFKTNDMQPTVRFNRIPSSTSLPVRVEYNYIPVPDDLTDDTNSIPVVPRDHRIALMYYATYYLLLDKTDSRVAEYRELARAAIVAMVRAMKVEKSNTNENYGRLIARPDGTINAFWPRRGRGGYY